MLNNNAKYRLSAIRTIREKGRDNAKQNGIICGLERSKLKKKIKKTYMYVRI